MINAIKVQDVAEVGGGRASPGAPCRHAGFESMPNPGQLQLTSGLRTEHNSMVSDDRFVCFVRCPE